MLLTSSGGSLPVSPRNTMSETAKRPPGLRTRNASESTFGLSVERLMTQLEITTSTWSSGSGTSSMWPFRNSTFSAPTSALFFSASSSISSVMSSPYALPPGATLLAESSTSMPPPLPRSSTTSPGESVAKAVGLPHPSEAAPAACGSVSSSSAEYPPPVQSTPSASESRPRSPADPQQEAVPVPSSTVSAAPAYLSLTLVRTSSPIKLSFQSIYLDQSMHQDMLICQGWEALCTEVRGRGILRSCARVRLGSPWIHRFRLGCER